MRSSALCLPSLACVASSLIATACTGTVAAPPGPREQQAGAASAAEGAPSTPPLSGTGYGETGTEGSTWMPASPTPDDAGGTPAEPAPDDNSTDPMPEDADASVPTPAPDAGAVDEPAPVEPGPPPDAEAESVERGSGLYPALCAGCHGQDGRGGNVNVRLTEPADFERLVNRIDDTMPKGNPDACSRGCAEDLARFILATFVD